MGCCPQVADLHAAALAQDASVFDYDGVYDSIQVRSEQHCPRMFYSTHAGVTMG